MLAYGFAPSLTALCLVAALPACSSGASSWAKRLLRAKAPLDECSCDRCEGKDRKVKTAVANWVCAPNQEFDGTSCGTGPGGSKMVTFAFFCTCNCQPFIAGMEKQCVEMSNNELAVSYDEEGNCEDPMLMTEIESREYGSEEEALAAAAAAKAGKPLTTNAVARPPEQVENLAAARAAEADARAQLEHVKIARENAENAAWLLNN